MRNVKMAMKSFQMLVIGEKIPHRRLYFNALIQMPAYRSMMMRVLQAMVGNYANHARSIMELGIHCKAHILALNVLNTPLICGN